MTRSGLSWPNNAVREPVNILKWDFDDKDKTRVWVTVASNVPLRPAMGL